MIKLDVREFYFSPYDDVLSAIASEVGKATKSIHVCDYSFNLEALVNQLIAFHQQGLDVQLALDKSQSGGKTEVPEIQALRDAEVPFVVGTSDKHKILHNKYIIIDGATVLYGSFNWTGAAEDEDNFMVADHNIPIAEAFEQNYQKIKDWIATNEPQKGELNATSKV